MTISKADGILGHRTSPRNRRNSGGVQGPQIVLVFSSSNAKYQGLFKDEKTRAQYEDEWPVPLALPSLALRASVGRDGPLIFVLHTEEDSRERALPCC